MFEILNFLGGVTDNKSQSVRHKRVVRGCRD